METNKQKNLKILPYIQEDKLNSESCGVSCVEIRALIRKE